MNFPPFGNHFPSGIPSIHQFAAKFTHENNSGNVATQTGNIEDNVPVRYSNQFQNQEIISQVKYHRDNSTQVGGNGIQSPNSKYQDLNHFNIPISYNGGQARQENESSQEIKREEKGVEYQPTVPPTWQSIAATGSTVADYLSHLPASTLPLSLHHFLKYSAETIKKDIEPEHHQPPSLLPQPDLKKRLSKKKKLPKEKKPRPKPGEIRLTTALDGSTLYCCPECQMAYPDKGLLEQHLLGHTMERRFFCDVCGAGLKRKDHLTRHKQSHNPERPFICTVCMKAFKRKEQLTLHFVIHSGEKRHVCPECGKGFYRKDHLRKHTRSHIARRVKTEINQNAPTSAQEGIS